MKRVGAVLLTATLLFSSCAAKNPPRLQTREAGGPAPGDQQARSEQVDAESIWRRFAEHLPIGSLVRVRSNDGERFTGTLLSVDDTSIAVSPRGRVPEPPRRIRYDQILQLDRASDKVTNRVKAAAVGASVGAATFLGVMWLIFAATN